MAYDTSTLLDKIKKKASIPQNQATFDDSEILEIASDAIEEELLPDILKARQEFFVHYDDVIPTKLSSDNYAWIRVPYRAVGQTIIGLYDPVDDGEIQPSYYWVENNKIYIDADQTKTYRVRYYLRPGQLVETSAVGAITAIDTATGVVTTSARPSTYTTNLTYDFVRGKAGFDLLAKDKSCSAFSTVTGMTFTTTDLPSELEVGDYVCISDQSPVPQIPVEWFAYLAQYTAAAVLESIGDLEGAKKVEAKLPKLRSNALSLISPRTERKSKVIKTNY